PLLSPFIKTPKANLLTNFHLLAPSSSLLPFSYHRGRDVKFHILSNIISFIMPVSVGPVPLNLHQGPDTDTRNKN
ncbi:hypothetical protein, partial [Chitinophaga sp.]|uniref:hypothetical protein n=1 Tax=Chitinophaga sp. TaxID=1869181 RepID=UPI0031DAA33B